MSLLYPGRIDKLEIGLTAADNVDITNVVLMNWERNHDVRPRLYANLKYPTTFQQPHSWIIGSFSLLSDNHDAIYDTDVQAAVGGDQFAMYEDADSNVIDFFQVTYQDEGGTIRRTRFYHAIIYRYNKELLNYDDSTWIYHFMAGYAIDADNEEDLEVWETWIDLMTKIDEFNDTTVSLSMDSLEVQNEYVGTVFPCNPGCTPCFYYNGATPRLYIFYEDGLGDIRYRRSQDGVTWTDVDTTANLGLSGFYSVTWDDTNVYLIFSDGVNIDCWVGTIADATGIITFGAQYNNVVALAGIMSGPTFDSQGHIWAVFYDGAAATTARGYESDDAGATWTLRLNPGANHELYALADVNSDGDVYGLVFDIANTDIELWTWDRSGGTFTFTEKIDDEDDCDAIFCCQDADYNITLFWGDVDADEYYLASNRTGVWVVTNTGISGLVDSELTSDGYYTYLMYADAVGGIIQKCLGATMGAALPIGVTARVGAPLGYTQDGHVGIFFIKTDADNDLWCLICQPEAIRLVEGVATGDIKTFAVTASATMTSWGHLTENALAHADQSWDVLNVADGLIVGGLTADVDLNAAGVPATTTTIKLQPTLTDTGVDPLLYSFTLKERVEYP